MTSILVRNAIQTPDGTILESHHVHDFKGHTDKNGRYYAVDGGLEYRRICCDVRDYKDLSLYSNAPHREIREKLSWGTYGKNGDEPLKYILLKDLETEHIKAILKTQTHLHPAFKGIFSKELELRAIRSML